LKSISRVKFSRYVAYIFIFISLESQAITLADFLNPLYSSEQSNEPSSYLISPKPNAATTTANKNGAPASTLSINPILDLGIDKGYVCFRVKAYSIREISDFSKAVCTYIKNSNQIKLTWIPSSNSVIGYHVYFGTSAKTTNFITDVM